MKILLILLLSGFRGYVLHFTILRLIENNTGYEGDEMTYDLILNKSGLALSMGLHGDHRLFLLAVME